jgi:hypothetical protein
VSQRRLSSSTGLLVRPAAVLLKKIWSAPLSYNLRDRFRETGAEAAPFPPPSCRQCFLGYERDAKTTMAGLASILSREVRFSDCLDIVAFRRASPLRPRTRLTPLPVGDLGHVIAILGNILLVFE